MKVSVVTCAWNRAIQTGYGLRSIMVQDEPPDEIILVDDGSVDDIGHVAVELDGLAKEKGITFDYIYLNHPEARISSFPRNVGLRNAKHEVVIFTEPECLHVGNTIKQIKDAIASKPEEVPLATQIWTVGPAIWKETARDRDDLLIHPAALLNHPYAQLTDDHNMQNTKAPDSDWGITGSINCYAGCLFGAYKKDLMLLQGFDEEFVGHGFDDFDLFERFKLIGRPIVPHNEIVVIHQWHEKNYPYNIYDCAKINGERSAERVKQGEYRANINNPNWGIK